MSKTILAADLFCGAGGTSTGMARACDAAGLRLDLTAVNHWAVAVETHSANHPSARHLCESLDGVDPRKLYRPGDLDLLAASPECTHHSIARGGRPVSDQSRATAWHVVRWADAVRPRAILVENVREFRTWGPIGSNGKPLKSRRGETFQAWLQALRACGYNAAVRVLNAADYGDATTRERLFVLAVRGRGRVLWPEPTHSREGGRDLFGETPRWRAAREIIDWALKGTSIFARKKPLSANTLRRIEAGLRKFCGLAFSLHTTHGGRTHSLDEPLPTVTGANRGEQDGQTPRTHAVDAPLPAVTTHGAGALIQPFLVQAGGPTGKGRHPRDVNKPLPTVIGQNHTALVEPFVVSLRGTAADQMGGARSPGDPLRTVSAGGNHHGLCEPFILNTGNPNGNGEYVYPASRPAPTVTGADQHALAEPFLVKYNGTGDAVPVTEPLHTVSTKDRFGLVQTFLLDVLFRMLQPHELAAAMSFPSGYRFAGNRGEQVKQIGNAVPCRIAEALCAALLGVASGRAAA